MFTPSFKSDEPLANALVASCKVVTFFANSCNLSALPFNSLGSILIPFNTLAALVNLSDIADKLDS